MVTSGDHVLVVGGGAAGVISAATLREVAAVPDIRRQALRLTCHLAAPHGAQLAQRLVG